MYVCVLGGDGSITDIMIILFKNLNPFPRLADFYFPMSVNETEGNGAPTTRGITERGEDIANKTWKRGERARSV